MTNKQVITIFGAGVLLLLVAFWAGMSVTRNGEAEVTTDRAGQPAPVQTAGPVASAQQQQSPTQVQEQPDPDARYLVLVGIFGTEEKAKELMATLRKRNYRSTHIEAAVAATGDKRYRVMIGPYNERRAADQVADELAADGRKGIKIERASN